MKLTQEEINKLGRAKEMAIQAANELQSVIDEAIKRSDIDKHQLWKLKNYTAQIEAIVYNVHEDVYRPLGEATS